MISQPVVSVILPTFNRGLQLVRSIKSVLTQTYEDLELIVVDDGSEDDIKGIIDGISDSRLVFVRLERNYGPSHARNIGVEKARGTYVAFHDSDDECLPDKIEKLVAAAQNAGADIVYNNFYFFNGAEELPTLMDGMPDDEHDDNVLAGLARRFFIGMPTMLMKKDVFTAVGGLDEKLRCGEDWDLAVRLAQAGYRFRYVPEKLMRVYHSEGSLQGNKTASSFFYEHMLTKHKAFFKQYAIARERFYKRLSDISFKTGFYTKGRKYTLAHFMVKPSIRDFVLVVAGYRLYSFMKKIVHGKGNGREPGKQAGN